MKSLRRILIFLKPYRREVVIASVLVMAVTVSDLAPTYLTQILIDEGVAKRDLGVIAINALWMILASVVGAAMMVGNTIYAVRASQSFTADLRSAVMRKVQTFSFGNLDKLQTGELIVRSTSDINQVQNMVLMTMRMLLRAPLWMLGSVALLIITVPQLAWIMAILIPILLFQISLFATRMRPMFMQVQKRLDRLNQVLQENLAGVRVVKAFVRERREVERFDVANDDLLAQFLKVGRFMSVLMPSIMMVVNIGIAVAVWFGGNQILDGRLTVGQLVAATNYLTRAMFPLFMLGGMIGPLSAADASAERIYEVLDADPKVQSPRKAVEPPPSNGLGARLTFEGVSFAYHDDGSEPVLCDLDLDVAPGQRVALLGVTGAGKSSLIHLIPRFYDVTAGRILLDGVDIRELPLRTLRGQIGISLQEAVLFSGSVRDNIRYGRPQATEEEVIAASQAAQAHEFVMQMPQGYDTIVGERGVNLSGGQKQRLAIARAILVRPRVLILDDSTSAVDIETEIKIEQALEELMRSCTSLIIAQRISTVLNADVIVVLDQGRVAAQGTHEQLMATSPIYREIYESQLGNGNGGNQHG
jgi:ATP-binding cassette subfamily B protein